VRGAVQQIYRRIAFVEMTQQNRNLSQKIAGFVPEKSPLR